MDFLEIRYSSKFRNSVENILVALISNKNNKYFTRRPKHIFIISRLFVLRLRNILNKIREHQNKLLTFNNVFRKSCRLWDNEEKYCRVEQTVVTIWHVRFAYHIPNSTNTRRKCWFFHWNNGFTNTPQRHVISTLRVLNSQFTEWIMWEWLPVLFKLIKRKKVQRAQAPLSYTKGPCTKSLCFKPQSPGLIGLVYYEQHVYPARVTCSWAWTQHVTFCLWLSLTMPIVVRYLLLMVFNNQVSRLMGKSVLSTMK
jgi:hypothetical protein